MATESTTDDWRKNILQTYRTEKINHIANVLASLEPSATPASKLMLATQFENMMFNTAESHADYEKKITKRLKKMQKNYKAPAATSEEDMIATQRREVLQKQRNLKSQYGESLQLIVENGKKTVEKLTRDRGEKLTGHIDQAIRWAAEFSVVPVEKAILLSTGNPVVIPRRTPEEHLRYFDSLPLDLPKRIENIRGYVLKATKVELFFAEKLQDLEKDVIINLDSPVYQIFLKQITQALREASIELAIPVSSLEEIKPDQDINVEGLKQLLENMKATIPPARNKVEEKEAQLVHLNRVRSGCQFYANYMSLSPNNPSAKLQLVGSMRKVHEIVNDSINFLRQTYTEDRSRAEMPETLLEDAWNKILDYDKAQEQDGDAMVSNVDNPIEQNSSNFSKKKAIVTKARVLFTKKKPHPSLMESLQKKHNVKVCTEGETTYLTIRYGNAFEMSIHFCPLLVRIRALPDKEEEFKFKPTSFRSKIVDCNLHAWNPSSYALKTVPLAPAENKAASVPGGKKRNASGKIKRTKQTVSIMGVSADVALLGPVVEKRMDFASASATRCLRRIFADNVKNSKSDFEIEISEGNAILKFLKISKSAYTVEETTEQ